MKNISLKRWHIFILLLSTVVNFSCDGGNLAKLIPNDLEIQNWERDGNLGIFKGNDLIKLINGGAEIYFEYGFIQCINQRYRNGDSLLEITIFEMKDPKSAFEIFSYHRFNQKSANSGLINCPNTISTDAITFQKGRYYIQIFSLSPQHDLQNILIEFAKSIEGKMGAIQKCL